MTTSPAYAPTQWVNGKAPDLTDTNLNHLEDGVARAHARVDGLQGSAAGVAAPSGQVLFDNFAGTTTDDKVKSLNAWLHTQQNNNGPMPAVRFACASYSIGPTPIDFVSGMVLVGGRDAVAHEYSRGTVLKWTGAAGTSLFVFPATQPNQGYPTDGSPRDVSLRFIQFEGGGSTHCFPKNDPDGAYAGKVIWMSNFHGCAWKNFATVWWGWGDGVTIDGVTHIQGVTDTAFYLAGSENNLFGNGSYSFMDTTSTTFVQSASAKPFIRSQMTKSLIGQVMVTARKWALQLVVEGGQDLIVRGFAFDAQDSDPVYGSCLRITGGDGIVLDGVNFKGAGSAPGTAVGGAAAHPAWVYITGGRQITFVGCQWRRAGSALAADTFPIVAIGPAVAVGQVKWGPSNYGGWPGDVVVQQSVAGQLVRCDGNDPAVTVTTVAA